MTALVDLVVAVALSLIGLALFGTAASAEGPNASLPAAIGAALPVLGPQQVQEASILSRSSGTVSHTYDSAATLAGVARASSASDPEVLATRAPGGGGGTVDFAQGTSKASARSIVDPDGGLNAASASSATGGGRYAQPRSFHTFRVTPEDTSGLEVAYEMGLKQGGDTCVVIRKLPRSSYDDLERDGHVITERISGVDIPQTVFTPEAYPIINRDATWEILKPGGS